MEAFQKMDALAKILINPLVLAALYIVWRFVKGGMGRRHIVILFIYFYLVSIPFTSKVIHMLWSVDDTIVVGHQYDAVVVLSGIVPSKCYLDNDQVYVENMFMCSGDFKRAYAGLGFVKSGQANRFIIADDESGGFHESKAVEAFLLNNQIRPDQIVIIGEVKNTKDEALKIEKMTKNDKINDFILVTSAKHMRRAADIFASRGLTPALYSTDRPINSRITVVDFKPSGTMPVQRMLYEFAGYIKFILNK
jgi:uncharacterized SAM-binding protein YcdF (DUF218 family)